MLMNQTIAILGRQPALGLAELESLFSAKAIQQIGNQAALINVDPSNVDFARLGGSTKLCKLLTYIPSTELPAIIKYISDTLPKHFSNVPSGKITIGLSFYGYSVSHGKINAYALSLKKNLKNAQRGVRLVPNKNPELNTAQVIHNKLTGPNGMELVLIKWGKRTLLAQTVNVQDIEAYAARDQARPKRDAKVGMLPPKLAQIIINLSATAETKQVFDPFCGTGVLLQEALLTGYDAYGTDLEPRMIDYSQGNLDWLGQQYDITHQFKLAVGDATTHQWPVFHLDDTIACETYLGRPFSAAPADAVLAEVIQDVDTIHRKFLRNVTKQTPVGFRMTIAIPAWKTRHGFKHLPTLDSLEELGYTRVSFVHAKSSELLYYRENQVVARELVTLIRK